MKRSAILFATAAMLIMHSCKQVSSQNYNETVVNMYSHYTTKLTSDLEIMGSTTADAARKKQAADEMDRLTDSCTTVMKGLEPVEEAKNFHAKMLAVYSAVKTDLVPLGRKMAAITKPENNVDAYNKLVEELNAASTKLDALETETQAAQAEFAGKVNMKIQ